MVEGGLRLADESTVEMSWNECRADKISFRSNTGNGAIVKSVFEFIPIIKIP